MVVDAELEEQVHKAIADSSQAVSRRERGSFKLKGRTTLQVTASQSSEAALPAPATLASLVKRTFIEVQTPSSMRSESSARPFTS